MMDVGSSKSAAIDKKTRVASARRADATFSSSTPKTRQMDGKSFMSGT